MDAMKTSTRTGFRATFAVLFAVAWVFATWFVGGFAGFPSETLGWLWATLAYSVGLVAAAVLLPNPHPRVGVPLALGVALLLGLADWQSSPPSHERIHAVADRTELPATWELEHENDLGSTWCFKLCPSVERTYRVDVPWEEARAELVAAFEEDGWQVVGPPDEAHVRLRDGRWTVRASAGYRSEGETSTSVYLSFTG